MTRRSRTFLVRFFGRLSGWLLATASVCQAQGSTPLAPTVLERTTTPARTSGPSLLPIRRAGGRRLITIGQDLLETDFLMTAGSRAPLVRRATPLSDVWRFQRAGDSLVVLAYVGTVGGRFRYERRAALPIRRVTPSRAFLVDAAPLWAALMPCPTESGTGSKPAAMPTATAAGALTLAEVGVVAAEIGIAATVGMSRPTRHLPRVVRILRLPTQPMTPRLTELRIPYMRTGPYITRWRLEKKDPAAAISDVVQPIVFRLNDSIPSRWVVPITQAIEAWNPAFEALGYRHAVVVRRGVDPAGAAAPAREVAVHWQAAQGGTGLGGLSGATGDPRTGEALYGNMMIDNGIVARQSRNALLAGELDPHTAMPLADSLEALLFRYVVEHEAGHALGLGDNYKGGGVYPTDSLRRPSFLRRMGSVTTVMGYSDANYVAQPDDHVPFADRVPRIGPFDQWAIAWAYRPIPGATTPEAEQPTLEQWRHEQDTTFYLQASPTVPDDPTNQPGAMGNDPVQSAGYGIRNLAHYAAALDPVRDTAETIHPQPSVVAQKWGEKLALAASVIGGQQPKPPFRLTDAEPIDSTRQVAALRFVLSHLFYGEDELVHQVMPQRTPIVLFDSLAPGWDPAPWQEIQQNLLASLPRSFGRLAAVPGTRRALCQELATLQTRLTAAAVTPRSALLQEQALVTLTGLLDPNRGGECG